MVSTLHRSPVRGATAHVLDATMTRPGKFALLTAVFAALILSISATLAWFYTETRNAREKSMSEMAQLKLSIELYGRQYTASATSLAELNATLKGLETRLADLEDSLSAMSTASKTTSSANQAASSEPETAEPEDVVEQAAIPQPGPSPQPAAAASSSDCVSRNSQFLVAAGDIFLVCGTSSWIAVADVGAQRIAFADGRSAYVGRSVPLEGTNCTVMVRSANAAWLAGFGELEINC